VNAEKRVTVVKEETGPKKVTEAIEVNPALRVKTAPKVPWVLRGRPLCLGFLGNGH
jgi:hypothetical protein